MAKNILITGASSGIGLHLAQRLADSSEYAVFAGVRKPADQKKIQDLNKKNLTGVLIDVQKGDSVQRCIEQFKDLYCLINNAGIAVASPLEFLPVDSFQDQMDVNVTGLLRTTQACLPLLRRSCGRVINIGSISGKVTTPLVGAYAASKHAVEAMSDAFRRELRQSGIKVALVEPGMIRTPIWQTSKDRAYELMEKIPAHAREIYQPMVDKLIKNLDSNLARATEPEAVFAVVKHALESSNPRARYLVGRDAKIANVIRHLPDLWVDRLIAKMGAAR